MKAGAFQFTDSLVISNVSDTQDIEELWDRLLNYGIYNLPPEIEKEHYPPDGHSYYFELRTDKIYRASFLGFGMPESEYDRKMFEMARLIDDYLGTNITMTKE